MRSITPSSVPQSRLERFADRAQRAVSSRTSHNFDSQLNSALNKTRGAAARTGTADAGRQTVAAPGVARQNSDASTSARVQDDPARSAAASTAASSAAAPSTAASSTAPPSWSNRNTPFGYSYPAGTAPTPAIQTPAASTAPAATTAATAQSSTTPAAAMDVLHEALRKANIEPSGLNLIYEEVPVYYPGGSYTNRQFTLELSNGAKESYDAALMVKNPWLTAFEIGRFMSQKVA